MSFVHPKADVAKCNIGEGTKVWQFVVVLDGAQIGKDCNICAHSMIEGRAVIGDRCTIKSGVFLWDGVTLEDDVFVGPSVTFTNDLFPRSQKYQSVVPKTIVRRGASIGANATILAGIIIGEYAMIGAGAVVVKDVPNHAVVVGNPAKIMRYLNK
ncbi:WxcM-like protein [alpha proteobacterium HTCC2255]|jgi:UDP-2-acetamido-3-amino-2,3-dideoxy-glucuronate N-acetyltransferase|nr:WxcM-like protein [alpha proteobacterium HTCC2255] [Rhodobacterales bacterium HTCC2255]